jgi:hypothetical protein
MVFIIFLIGAVVVALRPSRTGHRIPDRKSVRFGPYALARGRVLARGQFVGGSAPNGPAHSGPWLGTVLGQNPLQAHI